MKISKEEYDEYKNFCYEYIKTNCIITGTFPSKVQNQNFSYMFYMKRGLYNADFLDKCCKMLVYKIEKYINNFDFQITGMETGSTPLLIGLNLIFKQYDLNINTFSVRKEKKTYGLLNRIEGVPNLKKILIVDDIMNTGSTNLECRKYLHEENLNNIHDFNISILCKSPKPTDIYLFKWNSFNENYT